MASGDTLCYFGPLAGEPPTSNHATLGVRNSIPYLAFDNNTGEATVFSGVMPRHYSGNGVTVTMIWMGGVGLTSGNVQWDVSWERHGDDTDDLDSDGFASAQSANETTSNVSGEPKYTDVAFTNGSQMDSVVAGDHFRLKVARNPSAAPDDMEGDAQLIGVEVRET